MAIDESVNQDHAETGDPEVKPGYRRDPVFLVTEAQYRRSADDGPLPQAEEIDET